MHPVPKVERVLIAIDFSDVARKAFYTGVDLATHHDAEAYILHVSEPIRSFDFGKKAFVDTKETIERVEEGVKRRIDELWQEDGLLSVDRRKIHVVVRGGRAGVEICQAADAKNIDLIIMGDRGAGEREGIGSTAERVLRHAPCSVYCVRS